MEVVRTTTTHATITISRKDLGFLKSSINEVLEVLSDSQLHTRTGVTTDRAEALLRELSIICKAMDSHK
jgi:hypothetical protein